MGALLQPQARSLLAPHYDTRRFGFSAAPADDADLWRQRLFDLADNTYTLGPSERLDDFVRRLAVVFGCQPWSPRAKVNVSRPAEAEVSESTRQQILAFNWLDAELHAHVLRQFDG